ncbi:MAG: sugar phosphate nucleotidyltransferase [Promethearchaeota archaeon]
MNLRKPIVKLPVVILAAGQGKRLNPYTKDTPKPLLELHGRKILEYIILNLILAGIRYFIIITGFQAAKIENWIKNELCINLFNYCENKINKFSDSIAFSFIRQEKINGTGGAALLAENHVIKNGYSHFLLTYGDILVSGQVYSRLINAYLNNSAELYLVGNYADREKISQSAAIYYEGDFVKDIVEKPPKDAPITDMNNSGIYIFSKEIFKYLKETGPSVRGEIEITAPIKLLAKQNRKIRLVKMERDEFWCDIGTPETYNMLKKDKGWLKKIFYDFNILN